LKINESYSNLWKKDFSKSDVISYDLKWFNKFNKNIKHYEFLDIVKKYISSNMSWLDSPVGSGRFMREINCNSKFGFDYSHEFLDFIRNYGIKPIYGDINKYKFDASYDFVTCFNMLFAFSNPLDIISNLSKGCKDNGYLIFDLINDSYLSRYSHSLVKYPSFCTTDDVTKLLLTLNFRLVDIRYADFWDNMYFSVLFKKYTFMFKIINFFYFNFKLRFLFKIINLFIPKNLFLKKIYIFRKVKNEKLD
jgi:SAM-dependent methyltransferase